MGARRTTERDRAIAGLRGFHQEAASFRQALRGYERALERICRRLEQGEALHEVMRKIGVGDLRADLADRLAQFEAARHRMRAACFRMSLAEGLSIGEIARLWGISRQLASRLVHEALDVPGSLARSARRESNGALPPRLRAMIESRALSKHHH